MSGLMEIVLVLAAVGYVLVRRVKGEPAQPKRMVVLPCLLCLIGLSDLAGPARTPASLLFLAATAAVSVIIGALRGASVRISERDGAAFVRYTWLTLTLWTLNLVIKFGADIALTSTHHDVGALGNSLMLPLGLGILAEGLVVLQRASGAGHPVTWTQDRSSAPRRSSSLPDNLRDNAADHENDPHDDYRPSGWNTPRGRLRSRRRW